MGVERCHGKELKGKVRVRPQVSIVYGLQFVDIPAHGRGGMRGDMAKTGETAGGRGRMSSERNRNEREAIRRDPVRITLLSANPDYAPYTCLVQDVHILGKVLWVVRKV